MANSISLRKTTVFRELKLTLFVNITSRLIRLHATLLHIRCWIETLVPVVQCGVNRRVLPKVFNHF